MTDNQKIDNGLLGAFTTESEEQADGSQRQVIKIADSVGSAVISALSSTTALDDGQTFTSEWVDLSKYDSVVVAVSTDQSGTYSIQFSPDGVNQDSTLTRYYRTDQINAPHRFTITRQYCRVVFTNNSGSNQTYFRLQTMAGNKTGLNVPLDAVIAQDYDATAVRPTKPETEVALGRKQGTTLWNKFGFNADIDTATDPELIAAQGGAPQILSAASTLTIVSSSTDDDDGGIGANSVIITGLDANRDTVVEQVTLDGTTNVVTTSTWLGVNRVAVALAGASQENVGDITVTATTGGSVQALIPAGDGVTQQCIFFTPRSHTSLLDHLEINCLKIGPSAAPIVTVKGWSFSPVSNCKYELFRQNIDTGVENYAELNWPDGGLVLASQDVFYMTAETTVNDTAVNARFSLIVVRNADA